jgi:hypothetical protein
VTNSLLQKDREVVVLAQQTIAISFIVNVLSHFPVGFITFYSLCEQLNVWFLQIHHYTRPALAPEKPAYLFKKKPISSKDKVIFFNFIK